ncbi:hypothetical protein GCM10023329_12600 [Streptomyces sanyensis]|uniref:Uncharacterized protein n=1 Tax=Streptomyces sanyensis TaxID=568869 RepID=A0ABP8ZWV0_9ACTN
MTAPDVSGGGRPAPPGPGAGGGPDAGAAPARGRERRPPRQRESLPEDWAAARPASSRATGIRNGEQET